MRIDKAVNQSWRLIEVYTWGLFPLWVSWRHCFMVRHFYASQSSTLQRACLVIGEGSTNQRIPHCHRLRIPYWGFHIDIRQCVLVHVAEKNWCWCVNPQNCAFSNPMGVCLTWKSWKISTIPSPQVFTISKCGFSKSLGKTTDDPWGFGCQTWPRGFALRME